MKRIIVILVGVLLGSLSMNAQNETDALRYSFTEMGGTARYMSMGGAFGALGADFSTLSTNPAGIGMYRKSEFTITPSVFASNIESDYFNTKGEENKYNFNISNMGLILTMNLSANRFKDDDNGMGTWKNINFGFGFNRYNNFHHEMNIEGFNTTSSLLDDYKAKANGNTSSSLHPFDTELAWNTYLLDTLPASSTEYFSAMPSGGVLQRKNLIAEGAMNEMVFSMGANFNNRFYIGGTFGFPFIKYEESYIYKEIDVNNIAPQNDNTQESLEEFTQSQNLETRGSGFNFKLGMIYRINDMVRLGGAVHTPTFFSMTDQWDTEMTSTMDNGNTYSSESPFGEYDYQLTTPFRAMGNIAIIFGKRGLISADYEFVDYSEATLDADDDGFFEENDAIREYFTTAHNFRVGTEWSLAPMFVRGGFAMYSNPYSSTEINDAEKMMFSGGFGFRDKYYFLDFGYSYTAYGQDYYLYPMASRAVENKITNHQFLMTFGIRF